METLFGENSFVFLLARQSTPLLRFVFPVHEMSFVVAFRNCFRLNVHILLEAIS